MSTNGGTCRLYNDDFDGRACRADRGGSGPVGASEAPPSTEPWIAVCVEPVSPVDPQPSGFGGAALVAATAGAPSVPVEPYSSDGTALSVNADGTSVRADGVRRTARARPRCSALCTPAAVTARWRPQH